MTGGQLVAGRFEIVRLAGAGAMGEVHRAVDRTTGEPVALKLARSPTAHARFIREARLLAELRHPGIVRYVAHGVLGSGHPYLATEWLDGIDLRQALEERGRLSVPEAIALGRQVGAALGAAHGIGVVHRDVKPENLFLVGGDPGRVKLLDLGIARLSGASSLTRAGTTVGTPAYMAPEQARASRDLDARVDVFALGLVLYECIRGRPAFIADQPIAVMAKVLLEPVPRLDGDGVPASLAGLLERMLSKDPRRRPRHGAEVAGALAALGAAGASAGAPAVESAPALTTQEQQLVCVVLGRPGSTAETPGETFPMESPPDPVLADIATAAGAELVTFPDGSFVATLHGRDDGLAARESRAAGLALALADAAPAMALGLATGWAMTGSRLPVGNVVERAAGLLGEPGVAIDDETAGLLEERFDVRRTSSGLFLRGRRRGGAGARTLLGRVTPCVGRDHELVILETHLRACIEERMGRPVLVTGDAGAGKSRLRYELLKRIEGWGEPVTIWLGRGDPVSAGSAFGLVRRALRQAAHVPDGAPIDERQAALLAWAGRYLPGEQRARRVSEFLGEMLGIPFPDEESAPLRAARADARLMADQIRVAFEEVVVAECSAQPLVLVLEDLQWGDRPSVSYVDSALRVLGDRPWLILALARPEVARLFPDLWSERGLSEIRLSPLRPRAARALVKEVLGESADDVTTSRIVERAAGNAFALEELIRAEAEGRGGDLPATALGIAEARLAQLSPEARRLLRAASVFGEAFWTGGVRTLLGAAQASDLAEWLALLVDRELLTPRVESRFPGQAELVFRHGLLREAAYATLTDEDRTLGHRLAADWLACAGEPDASVLAEHYERGGEREHAARSYLRAARQALEGDDLAAVLDRVERGASLAAGSLKGQLRQLQAEALRWQGEHAAARTAAAEAFELLPRGSAASYAAATELAAALGPQGEREELERLADELLAIEPAPGTISEAVTSMVTVGVHLLVGGGHEPARVLEGRVGELVAATVVSDAAQARLEMLHGQLAMHAGDPEAFLERFLAALACFERAHDRRHACFCRVNTGTGLNALGCFGEAEVMLEEALFVARRLGMKRFEAAALSFLCGAKMRLGKLAEAKATGRAAADLFGATGDRRMEGASRARVAEALIADGDLVLARVEAERALPLVESSAPPLVPWAIAVLARIELGSRAVPAALAAAERARALLEELPGVEWGEGLVLLTHVEALEAAGRSVAAREALGAARARLLATAGRIADPGRREAFLSGFAEHARLLALAAERLA